MSFKENKEGHIGGFGGRKGKEERMLLCYNLKTKKRKIKIITSRLIELFLGLDRGAQVSGRKT